MAGSAILSKLSIVFIILLVAGIAVSGGTLENMINMTVTACNVDMFPRQLECRQVMVKFGGCPTIRSVTGTAVHPQPALVDIIFLVAGTAILRSSLKVRQGAGIFVAFAACYLCMFPC